MQPTLNDLITMASGAGQILRAGFNQPQDMILKREIDVVTQTDKDSETYLLNEIQSRFPGHFIVSEESGEMEGDQRYKWYIDPLDGTSNFAAGLPIFSVSIGYELDGEMVLGVVYDPIRDEMFSAEKNKGAFLNNEPIRVGSQSELRQSLVVTGFPYDRFTSPVNNLSYFTTFALQVRSIRRLGSAALDLCYVAADRADGYWEFKMESWDIAAGILIAQESGALVTTMDNKEDLISLPHSILVANPNLHAAMLEVIRKETAKPENQPVRDFLNG